MKAGISFESGFCQQLRPGMLSIDTLKEVNESHPAVSVKTGLQVKIFAEKI